MRTFLLGTVFLAMGLAAGIWFARTPEVGEQVQEPSSPLQLFQARLAPGMLTGWNLLLVTLDTVRADHIGCYGYARAETPRIDALAAGGAQFDHAVAGVPSTLPSHCTMMTGLEAPNHGVRTNGHFTLGSDVTTMAEILKNHGYATSAYIGTFVLNRRFGLSQGFDTYDDFTPYARRASGPRRADYITDAAIAWLDDQLETAPEQPFFAWTHYFDAHKSYTPPGDYGTRFADSPYDGEIAYVDAHLGRLLDYLDSKELLGRTLIVVTADHGEGLGEHGEPTHSRLIYDTTVHVPLIISCPQLYETPCRVDEVTVGMTDIMPTVLSLLGIETGLKMDGLDLVTATVRPDRAIYIESLSPLIYHGWASQHGLRRIDAKYVAGPNPQYFDLTNDRGELNNLLETDPRIGEQLASELEAFMSQWSDVEEVASGTSRLPQRTADRLAALGYVSTTDPDDAKPQRRRDPKDMVPLFKILQASSDLDLHRMALKIVSNPMADRGARRRAVILAWTAHRRVKTNLTYLTTFGFAQYRMGDYALAAETFGQVREELTAKDQRSHPGMIACSALALHQLGRLDQARAELDRLPVFLKEGGRVSDEVARGFLAEANATILGQ